MSADNTYLMQSEWCKLPVEQRDKLREVFGVPKTGNAKVQSTPEGDKLVSDGTESKDLLDTINIKSILGYLGEKHDEGRQYDFDALWKHVLERVFPGYHYANVPISNIVKGVPKEEIPETTKPAEVAEEKKIVVTQKKAKAKK